LAFDLNTIEALAPDQASLSSASKLTKRASWVRLERRDALLWGECQGSGANPYRVVVDAGDQGYKCTCPSRKFPCKHSLALMWISATASDNFAPSDQTPEWVDDWLGRRRKGGGSPAATSGSAGKNIGEAEAAPVEVKAEDPAATERREAAQCKRAEDTQVSIAAGLDELDQWISDQLRLGLSSFVDASGERCRRIAARLVDAKAAALASRLDEFPAFLMQLRSEERPEAAMRELGKLVLLARAWRGAPNDPELRRLVATSETREQVLANPDAPRVSATWEVLGERIETRRDGLVSHATWLLAIADAEPRFALLQDYYPASAGRRSHAFSAGERFDASLVFYPARWPLRALVAERGNASPPAPSWPKARAETAADALATHAAWQDVAPWSSETPILLPAGSLARDDRGAFWWQADGEANGIALPVAGSPPEPALGVSLTEAVGVWDGFRLDLLAARSTFGRFDFS
jgi:SWIM zinc finger